MISDCVDSDRPIHCNMFVLFICLQKLEIDQENWFVIFISTKCSTWITKEVACETV